jgi:hypothetical protein
MRHYVYVTKGKCGRQYIGVRSCECDPANDPYMGSHKDPEYFPTEKWIWSEFDTREEAANTEASLHEVFDVAASPHFANRCKACPDGFSLLGTTWADDDPRHNVEWKIRQSEMKLGERNPQYGKTTSQKQKEAVSRAWKGKKRSEETRQRMREAQKGLKKPPGYAERMSALKKEYRWFYDPIENKAHLIHPNKAETHWIEGHKKRPEWLG